MNYLCKVVKFALIAIALFCVGAGQIRADEQPPYDTPDPAISENFRNIYLSVDKLSLLSTLFTYTLTSSSNVFCIDNRTFCVDAIAHTVSQSSTTFSGVMTAPSAVLSGAANPLVVDATTLVVDATNHRVGIGTTTPDAQLHIKGSSPEIHLQGTGSVYSYWDRGSTSDEAIAKFSTAGTIKAGIGLDNDGTDNLSIFVNGNFGTPTVIFTPSNGVKITGTTTNDSAATGFIGEYISSSIPNYQSVGTSSNYFDLASITLTAGDWDVSGTCNWNLNGAVISFTGCGIGTVAGNSSTGLVDGDTNTNATPPTAASDNGAVVPPVRKSLSATTIIYLKGLLSYTTATPRYKCRISARRVR